MSTILAALKALKARDEPANSVCDDGFNAIDSVVFENRLREIGVDDETIADCINDYAAGDRGFLMQYFEAKHG